VPAIGSNSSYAARPEREPSSPAPPGAPLRAGLAPAPHAPPAFSPSFSSNPFHEALQHVQRHVERAQPQGQLSKQQPPPPWHLFLKALINAGGGAGSAYAGGEPGYHGGVGPGMMGRGVEPGVTGKELLFQLNRAFGPGPIKVQVHDENKPIEMPPLRLEGSGVYHGGRKPQLIPPGPPPLMPVGSGPRRGPKMQRRHGEQTA
jgi:hypothetical protein